MPFDLQFSADWANCDVRHLYMTICLRAVFQGMAESERTPGCDSPKPGGTFWQLVSPDNTFRLPEAMIFVGSAECDVLVKVSYLFVF